MASIGDKVRFLNETGGGVITKINNETATVLCDDGFEVPYKISGLVVIKGSNKNKAEIKNNTIEDVEKLSTDIEKSQITELKSYKNYPTDTEDVFIAFVEKNNNFNLFLINNTEFDLFYVIGTYDEHSHVLLKKGELLSKEKINICNYSETDLINLKEITLQAIKYKTGYYNIQSVLNSEIKLKPYKLIKRSNFTESNFFTNNSLIVKIVDKITEFSNEINLNELIKEKEQNEPDKSRKFSKRAEPVLVEVDLHINKLIDSIAGLTNTEMLNIQLNTFRKELEKAISDKNVNKIVFIHGVGNGTLKVSIRKELDELYSHYQYQDASFKEYGFGATMVILRKF